jgi:hypothetical protein
MITRSARMGRTGVVLFQLCVKEQPKGNADAHGLAIACASGLCLAANTLHPHLRQRVLRRCSARPLPRECGSSLATDREQALPRSARDSQRSTHAPSATRQIRKEPGCDKQLTDRQIDRQIHRQTDAYTHTNRQTDSQADRRRHTDRQIHRQTDAFTHTDRQIHRQTDADTQINRQTHDQTHPASS